MLRPLYSRKSFDVLLIGPPNSGKRTLAKRLIRTKDVFYSVKTAESVLAETTRDVEFVFILVDMTNKQSLDVLNSCLEHFKLKFLTNNVAIILTKVDRTMSWSITEKEVEDLIQQCWDAQVLRGNLSSEDDLLTLSDQLNRLLKIKTLQVPLVTSILSKTLESDMA